MHFLWKKISSYYNQKRIAVCLVFCLIISCSTKAGGFFGELVKEAEAAFCAEGAQILSMTELYNDGSYGVEVNVGDVVTISSKEELEMLREYVEAGKVTEGIIFRQMANITISEYTFQYDEESQRAGFYLEEELLGTVNREGAAYPDYSSNEETSLRDLGIITSEQKNWDPIGGDADWPNEVDLESDGTTDLFRGDFDGNGYVIEGLWCVSRKNRVGLFSYSRVGEIYNVTMINSLIIGNAYVGAIAGQGYVMENCSAETIVMGTQCCGGLNGSCGGSIGASHSEMRNCTSKGVIVGEDTIGGCMGDVRTGSEIRFCNFIGDESQVIGNTNVGGVIGYAYESSIDNCKNRGMISGKNPDAIAGGIVGRSYFCELWQCENYGIVMGYRSGGIVSSYGSSERGIYRCVNYGNISGVIVGGITGEIYESSIIDCENRGVILDGNEAAGGIAGRAGSYAKIQNCSNRGEFHLISDFQNAGGILGIADESGGVTIQNCLNIESMEISTNDSEETSSEGHLGSICGTMDGKAIKNCYYSKGDVTCTGTGEAIVSACYAVTGSQIRGTEQSLRICQEEGSYAYTTSVVEALNNALSDINEMNADLLEDVIILQSWELDEEGLPTICNIGAEEPEPGPVLPATLPPTAEPTQEPTLEPTESPMPTETPIPTQEPTLEPTESPIPSEAPIPTQEPTLEPSEPAEPTILVTPTPTQSPQPTNTPIETSVSTPTLSPIPDTPASIQPEPVPITTQPSDTTPEKVTGFVATPKAPKKVNLSWNASEGAQSYEIYRSTKKKAGYRLIKTVTGKTKWTDKKVKKGKKYFYKIIACKGEGASFLRSDFSEVKKVKQPWYNTPKVKYTKGTTSDHTKCLIIRLKKYQGTHVEIRIKRKGKKYQKLPLQDSRIKSYKGVFRLTYSKSGETLTCKVRTFRYNGKKKRYSLYTKAKKIRL